MSEAEIETVAPEATAELYDGPSTMSPVEVDTELFKDKMDYISLQIALLEPDEKTKFTSDFKVVSKSMLPLRKALRAKEISEAGFQMQWKFLGCVSVMLLIFG